ncbi:MAG: dihydrodipicolinate reductase, partial [Planctomycetes bacterium]|nr:dihydrodipicolinate reductase [Planctomycetota bacterium]
ASSFKVASGHMRPFISCGIPVVSSCEEASFPYTTDPACAATVDEWAQSTGVAVLGTGINPGFLMDLLPIALSAPMARVDRVRVERIQDAGRRRLPFQQKVGAGLELADFQAKIDDGSLRHVGLTESMHMIGEAFGFDLERTEDRIEPLVAADAVASAEIRVRAGQARGVRQTGRAWRKNDDQAVIEMTFIAGIGESDPVDRVTLDGDPGIVSEIRGGVPGDLGTCSILVNAIPRVVAAQPGLITMLDLPPVFCWRPA